MPEQQECESSIQYTLHCGLLQRRSWDDLDAHTLAAALNTLGQRLEANITQMVVVGLELGNLVDMFERQGARTGSSCLARLT